MKMNISLQDHYRLLLGLSEGWQVQEVDLDVVAKQVTLRLEWEPGRKGACGKCGKLASVVSHK